MVGCTPKSIHSIETDWSEEKSYDFLPFFLLYKDWFVYSTRNNSSESVLQLSDLFSLTHGRIAHPEVSSLDFWSVNPIGVFKFKILESGSFDRLYYSIEKYNKPGYIVEGAYWSNGFYYHVVNEDIDMDNYVNELIELNLFIDKNTLYSQGYPETSITLQDFLQ
jgi:hypothetical protein